MNDCFMGCLILLQIFLTAAFAAGHPAQAPQPAQSSRIRSQSAAYLNTAPGVKYVGSKACAGCHQQICETFGKTDMGRSMSTVTASLLEKIPSSATVSVKALNRSFQVYRQGPDLFQSEFELDATGKEVFRETHKVDYVVGSGANGLTPIVRRGDYLFEAPLSFYTKTHSWGPSPGYDLRDYGFDRPIQEGCVACHSGRPQPDREGAGRYRDPPFEELTIACETCHGPGELHVRERKAGAPAPARGDLSIVNPARVPSWLADNICMYCHQGGDVRVVQPARDYLDNRPGMPLDDTLAILMVP